MKRSYIVLALIPFIIGLLVGLVLNLTAIQNPIVYLRADLGTIIFLIGIILSTLISIGLVTFQRVQAIVDTAYQQAAADRRRFIQRLDHELKNPLTAILAGLANLANGQSKEQKDSSLKSVETQVQRLSRLIADLRKLSDLETRQLELSTVNLSEMLQEVFDFAQVNTQDNPRQLSLQIPQAPWPLPNIVADHDLLFLAVLNLLDNAIKYSQPDDTIELRASENANTVVIEVADTGPGIPEDEIDEVWRELFRGRGARGIQGSGLGLALVQAIVTRHNGDTNIRSRPNQGTVVSIQLPTDDVTKL